MTMATMMTMTMTMMMVKLFMIMPGIILVAAVAGGVAGAWNIPGGL